MGLLADTTTVDRFLKAAGLRKDHEDKQEKTPKESPEIALQHLLKPLFDLLPPNTELLLTKEIGELFLNYVGKNCMNSLINQRKKNV